MNPPGVSGARAVQPPRAHVVLHSAVAMICAGSAGVHAALVPAHFADGRLPLAAAFAASSLAAALAALAVRNLRCNRWTLVATAALLVVIAAAYTLSRIAGIPLVIGEPEDIDTLGVLTSAAELVGAACAGTLFTRKDRI